jgi:hypothetical protein
MVASSVRRIGPGPRLSANAWCQLADRRPRARLSCILRLKRLDTLEYTDSSRSSLVHGAHVGMVAATRRIRPLDSRLTSQIAVAACEAECRKMSLTAGVQIRARVARDTNVQIRARAARDTNVQIGAHVARVSGRAPRGTAIRSSIATGGDAASPGAVALSALGPRVSNGPTRDRCQSRPALRTGSSNSVSSSQ